jgi:phage gpG-like protein
MINIDVKIDTSRFDRMMSDLPGAMARAQKRALEDIGTAVESRATRAFKNPNLRPATWAPRKPSKHDDGHPLLIKHPRGGLWKSITHRLEGADTVVVGSDKEYAGYHQTGTKHMPARPFFPVDANGRLVPEMERKIQRVARKAYEDELKKLFGQ